MKIKMILPALTKATSPFFRPILVLDDEPDLVVIHVDITSARR